jgi:hypothetical protein
VQLIRAHWQNAVCQIKCRFVLVRSQFPNVSLFGELVIQLFKAQLVFETKTIFGHDIVYQIVATIRFT